MQKKSAPGIFFADIPPTDEICREIELETAEILTGERESVFEGRMPALDPYNGQSSPFIEEGLSGDLTP